MNGTASLMLSATPLTPPPTRWVCAYVCIHRKQEEVDGESDGEAVEVRPGQVAKDAAKETEVRMDSLGG